MVVRIIPRYFIEYAGTLRTWSASMSALIISKSRAATIADKLTTLMFKLTLI